MVLTAAGCGHATADAVSTAAAEREIGRDRQRIGENNAAFRGAQGHRTARRQGIRAQGFGILDRRARGIFNGIRGDRHVRAEAGRIAVAGRCDRQGRTEGERFDRAGARCGYSDSAIGIHRGIVDLGQCRAVDLVDGNRDAQSDADIGAAVDIDRGGRCPCRGSDRIGILGRDNQIAGGIDIARIDGRGQIAGDEVARAGTGPANASLPLLVSAAAMPSVKAAMVAVELALTETSAPLAVTSFSAAMVVLTLSFCAAAAPIAIAPRSPPLVEIDKAPEPGSPR